MIIQIKKIIVENQILDLVKEDLNNGLNKSNIISQRVKHLNLKKEDNEDNEIQESLINYKKDYLDRGSIQPTNADKSGITQETNANRDSLNNMSRNMSGLNKHQDVTRKPQDDTLQQDSHFTKKVGDRNDDGSINTYRKIGKGSEFLRSKLGMNNHLGRDQHTIKYKKM
jgi:hypothetical protein